MSQSPFRLYPNLVSLFRVLFLLIWGCGAIALPAMSHAAFSWSNARLGVDAGWGLGWGSDLEGYGAVGSRLSVDGTYRVFTETDIGVFWERFQNASSTEDGVDQSLNGFGVVVRGGVVSFPVFADLKLGTIFSLGGGYRFPIFYFADLCPHAAYSSFGGSTFLSVSVMLDVKF